MDITKYKNFHTKIICNAMINACTDYLNVTDKYKKDFGICKITVGEVNSLLWPLTGYGPAGDGSPAPWQNILSDPRAAMGTIGDSGFAISTKRSGKFHGTAGGRRAYKLLEFFRRVQKYDGQDDWIQDKLGVAKYRNRIAQDTAIWFLTKRIQDNSVLKIKTSSNRIYRSSLASFVFIELLNYMFNFTEIWANYINQNKIKKFVDEEHGSIDRIYANYFLKYDNSVSQVKEYIKHTCESFSKVGVRGGDGVQTLTNVMTAGTAFKDKMQLERKNAINDFVSLAQKINIDIKDIPLNSNSNKHKLLTPAQIKCDNTLQSDKWHDNDTLLVLYNTLSVPDTLNSKHKVYYRSLNGDTLVFTYEKAILEHDSLIEYLNSTINVVNEQLLNINTIIYNLFLNDANNKSRNASDILGTHWTGATIVFDEIDKKSRDKVYKNYQDFSKSIKGKLTYHDSAYKQETSREVAIKLQGLLNISTGQSSPYRQVLGTHQRSTIIIPDKEQRIHHVRISGTPEPCHSKIYQILKIKPDKMLKKYIVAKRLQSPKKMTVSLKIKAKRSNLGYSRCNLRANA